ncbi:MAG: ADP-dependent glucokinase/phosphofructokinase [Spirochaetales bacterium]|nr:ADP-dependent glucokinase/phosphofructokinase [Spirochaetales bacterium]
MGERIVLGFGNNIDYEVTWDSSVIERLASQHGVGTADLRTDTPIRGVRDLVISILAFLRSGSGGERFVESPRAIPDFVRHLRYTTTLGGTAMRAALAMRVIGYTSALHLVTLNDEVRRKVPEDCPWICSAQRDTLYPHLIVQFGRGETVRIGTDEIRAPAANRIIYVHDPDNAAMAIHPDFAALAEDARVVLVSGFNAVRDHTTLEERTGRLRELLSALQREAIVVYEDAGFHDPALPACVNDALADRIDIHSLNEDELFRYVGRSVSLTEPIDVYAALEELRRIIPAPTLVIHTARWAAAYGEGAARYHAALQGGVTMATARLRKGDRFSSDDYRETGRLAPNERSASFSSALAVLGGDNVCCVPSFSVDETDITTIGLGDAFVGGFIPALIDE